MAYLSMIWLLKQSEKHIMFKYTSLFAALLMQAGYIYFCITLSLFVAVLVDNFQRTITAVEVKPLKKHSGLQIKSVFNDVSI